MLNWPEINLLLLALRQRIVNKSEYASFLHEDAVWFQMDTILTDPSFMTFCTNLIDILGYEFLLKAFNPRYAGQLKKMMQRALLS